MTSHAGCFTPAKEPHYTLNRGLGGPQSRSEEEKKAFIPGGYRLPAPRLVHIFSTTTDLYLVYILVNPTNITLEYLASSMFLADTVHVIEQRAYSPTQNSTKSELSVSRIYILLSV